MIPQLEGLNREERREALRQLALGNRNYPNRLVQVSDATWPPLPPGWHRPRAVMRSNQFMVQIFDEDDGMVRLSVNRTEVDETTWRWRENISWDDLQALKYQAGYGECDACEIYPPDHDVVNVANMRHLWVMPGDRQFVFAWRKKP